MSKNFSDYDNLTSLFTGIRNKNVDIEKNIAPVESDASSSSRAYAVNSRLILGDKLYKVIAAIDIGDALVVDTNIELSSDLVTLIGQGGGGGTYTAGAGIDISEQNEISSEIVMFTGTHAEWDALTLQEKCVFTHASFTDDAGTATVDNVPTENSEHLVKSGGVYSAIEDVDDSAAKKSENNTFSGTNTFNAHATILKNSNIDITTAPAETVWGDSYHSIQDKNGNSIFAIQPCEDANGIIDLNLSQNSTNNPNGNVCINGYPVKKIFADVTGDGLKTIGQLLTELKPIIYSDTRWTNQIPAVCVILYGMYYHAFSYMSYQCTYPDGNLINMRTTMLDLNECKSYDYYYATNTVVESTSHVVPSGEHIIAAIL